MYTAADEWWRRFRGGYHIPRQDDVECLAAAQRAVHTMQLLAAARHRPVTEMDGYDEAVDLVELWRRAVMEGSAVSREVLVESRPVGALRLSAWVRAPLEP